MSSAAQVATYPAGVLARGAEFRETAGLSVLTTRAAFEALAVEWRDLERLANGPVLFQSFDWCRAVWDHCDRHGIPFAPSILALRREGRLVGLLPLQLLRHGLARIATGFGEPYQQYTEIVLAPDAPADAAEQLLRAAKGLPGSDGLQLLKVRDDSPLAPLLRAAGALESNADAAPFVDLRPFPEFSAYLATVNAKTRKNMRNARNRLARTGALVHEVVTDAAGIDALITRAHEGRERWLQEQGLTSRAFRDPTFGAFGRAIAQPGSGLSTLAMTLKLGDTPIAEQWGLVLNGRYYAYVATWTPGFEEASPGKLHLEEVIRTCHERGIETADFLMPAVRYKFTWTDTAVPAADYAIAVTPQAWLQFSLWSGIVRPLLKQLALKLPSGIRTRIAGAILRRR